MNSKFIRAAIRFAAFFVFARHGYKTGYSYDTLNNLATVNQGAQTRSFTYSSLSRLLSAQNPESGTISYAYDPNGNLTSKQDARSITTSYAYDALNRVTQRSYDDNATPPVHYTYDDPSVPFSKGKITKVTIGAVSSPSSVSEHTEFDALGRIKKSKQRTDGTTYPEMEYTYNRLGALIEQKYPSGRIVKNTLDDNGRLSIVQSKKNSNCGFWNYARQFTYTASGTVSSMQLGNGRWESTVFNSRLQPTQIALGTLQNQTDKLKLDYIYNTTESERQ
ncbi:MAG: RHS repeat protein [Acidobacteria bacterium]|nr:RHS repeat protein [Acidobacteriota bacterium]